MSVFTPSHEPPVWWERWLSHGGLPWIALWSVIVGVKVIVDPWVPSALFSVVLGDLPAALATGLGVVLTVGGGLCLWGLLTPLRNRSKSRARAWSVERAWATERAGWWLSAVGWAAYSVVVFQHFPGSTISWGSSLLLAVVGGTRIWTLELIERAAERLRDRVTGPNPVVPRE